jgi:hypothetical protein
LFPDCSHDRNRSVGNSEPNRGRIGTDVEGLRRVKKGRKTSRDCAVRISGWHAMLFESRAISADVALKYDPNVAKNIGPGFVQLWEPWPYLAVTVIAVCSAIWCMTAIFLPELHRLGRRAGRKS